MAPCWTRRQSRSPGRWRTSSDPAPRERRRPTTMAPFASWASLRGSIRSSSARPGSSRRASRSPSSPERAPSSTSPFRSPARKKRSRSAASCRRRTAAKSRPAPPTASRSWKRSRRREIPGRSCDRFRGSVSSVNVGGVRGGVSARSSSVRARAAIRTRINVDGVTISLGGFSYAHFDFDSLDSIGVTTGAPTRRCSSPGVTINLVTKRGTNRARRFRARPVHGRLSMGLRPRARGPSLEGPLWIWGAGASNSFLGQTEFLPDGEPSAARRRTRTGTPS